MNDEIDSETPTPRIRTGTRDLHVKAIPESVWVRARCNATQSGLHFKEYMIRLLGACEPISDAAPPIRSK